MKLREALGDEAAATASRQNLSFVLPPVSTSTERPITSASTSLHNLLRFHRACNNLLHFHRASYNLLHRASGLR